MLVRCPQCKYANQVEVDATKPRIVCARCATVISIEFLSSPSVPYASDRADSDLPIPDPPVSEFSTSEFSTEEQLFSESLFMKTPESPLDLDSLLESPLEAASPQPLTPVPSLEPLETPVLEVATPPVENQWDMDEVLDIPRANAATESQSDSLAVEDLLATDPIETAPLGDLTESIYAEASPVVESATVNGDVWTEPLANEVVTPQTAAYSETPQTQYINGDYSELVQEPTAEPSNEQASVFAQDSYTRTPGATYVMATPDSGNKGRLAKIFLATAVLFGLLGIGYFALSGLIKNWLGAEKTQTVTATPSAGGTGSGTPATAPSGAPSLGTKPSPVPSGKNASPSPSASVASSAKPSPSASASPAANQNAAAKPTATPATAQTGSSGHSPSSGEGSLALQVGAYKTPAEAQARVAKLKSSGVDARFVKAEVPGKGTWYRVQLGRFANDAEASKHAGELRAKGVVQDYIVTGYQNQ